jgi:translation initiation factor 2B subunit (eIF-2B alpha/beta/delta family)
MAMKKCDLFLFGADAFSKKYVANKIGTSTLVKIAKLYGIPRFSCGVSMKFTKKITLEKRSGREVWDEREKNIEVENLAFDKTKLKNLAA